MAFEYFIGRRYLKTGRRYGFISLITLLSVAGITVGVMALIVVIAVMAGFETDLKSRILGVQSHILLEKNEGNIESCEDILQYLKGLEGVAAATPVIHSQVMLRSDRGAAGVMLRGVDPKTAHRVIEKLPAEGMEKLTEAVGGSGAPGIVLGKELARQLGVIRGDSLFMISPRGLISPVGHMPSMKRFVAAGVFASGMYEYDSTLAFVRLDEAARMMRTGGAVTGIEIRVHHMYEAKEIAGRISSRLGADFKVRDWTEMNRTFFSALKLEKTAMFVILTLIVMVAAFNIASSLTMMVMEKTRDIAILKAMGATDRSIRKIFVFKGAAVGCAGTVIGVCTGMLLCVLLEHYRFIELPPDIYYITTLPVRLEIQDVCLIAVSALGISLAATLLPAGQAARQDPIEAIRNG